MQAQRKTLIFASCPLGDFTSIVFSYENGLFCFAKELFHVFIKHLNLSENMFTDEVIYQSLDDIREAVIQSTQITPVYKLFKPFKEFTIDCKVNLWSKIKEFSKEYENATSITANKYILCTKGYFKDKYITVNIKHGYTKHNREFENEDKYTQTIEKVLNEGKAVKQKQREVDTWEIVLDKIKVIVKYKSKTYFFSTMFDMSKRKLVKTK